MYKSLMACRSLSFCLVASLTAAGCIVVDETGTVTSDDGPFPGTATDGPPPGDGQPGDGADDGDDDDDDDDDGPRPDDGPGPDCSANVLEDGGLELGTPNPHWAEASPLFATPICNSDCSEDPGAEPYSGDWFAWFGGAQRPDVASLTQTFAVNADSAQLRFRFWINASAGSGDDVFRVYVDNNTVFMRTDADIDDFNTYTLIPVTLDQFADGELHELRIESEVFGGGLTNFFVDSISIVGCGAMGPATGDDAVADESSDGLDSTAGSTDTGTGGSGTDSGTTGSGWSSGGSSGSTSGSSGSSSDGISTVSTGG